MTKAGSQDNNEDSSIFDQYIQPTRGELEANQSFSQESESDIDDVGTKATSGKEVRSLSTEYTRLQALV